MNIKANISKAVWHGRHFGLKRLIYSAGMPRSGSTLLFNMLKLTLQSGYRGQLRYGWIEDVGDWSDGDIFLIKTHHLNRLGIWRAYRTFYTYRDVRDVLVSRLKKFQQEPTIDVVRYYIRQFEVARNNSVVMLKYEEFIDEQVETVSRLSSSLEIDIDPAEIVRRLPDPAGKVSPGGGHDDQTLLHKNHVTGTQHREWEKILPRQLQEQIHREFGWWLKENNYDTNG